MNFLIWIKNNRWLFQITLIFCIVFNNIIYYQHVLKKMCRQDDFTYFFRLWRAGNPTGKIVMILSLLAIFSGTILITTLFI